MVTSDDSECDDYGEENGNGVLWHILRASMGGEPSEEPDKRLHGDSACDSSVFCCSKF